MFLVWLEFIICTSLILISGNLLAKYGDRLSEITGMGRTWIGLIFLATVTSLPELATGISAVTVANVPEIAVGSILGSCVFNLMLIGLMDWIYRPGPILTNVSKGNLLSVGYGIILIGVVGTGILLGDLNDFLENIWIGFYTPIILLLWIIMMRRIFMFEKNRMKEIREIDPVSLGVQEDKSDWFYPKIFVNAGIILAAGIWLPYIAGDIAEGTGWGETFVGSFLVAASTSLPEVATSLAALRLGAPDLAIANLFGSNLFNIAILGVSDIFYNQGPLLSHVSINHLVSVLFVILMTGVCISGLIFPSKKKILGIWSREGLSLLLLYALNVFIMFSSVDRDYF